jgi:ParB-like chromosome segregation protein Spo0J
MPDQSSNQPPIHELHPVDWFDMEKSVNPSRARSDPDAIQNLADSIVQHGQLQPVLATEDGCLIAGFQRLAAVKLAIAQGKLDPAKFRVSVMVYRGKRDASREQTANFIENVQRSDLSDRDVYSALKGLLELHPEWDRQTLAAHVAKSPSWMTRALSPGDLIPEALDAFMAGKFGFSKAYSISKSPDQAATLALVLSGETRDSIERRSRKPKPAAAVRAARIKCPLPSGHVVTISGGELSLEEAVDAAQEAARQMKAAIAKGVSAKSAQAYWKDVAAAG